MDTIGALKVMNISTTMDARMVASSCVVIGQIHSNEEHKNEPGISDYEVNLYSAITTRTF